MKNTILKIIFVVCIIFILLGIGTVLKGDIENGKEAWTMVGYLSFFLLVILVIKRTGFRKSGH